MKSVLRVRGSQNEQMYRVTMVVAHLGLADLDLRCSTLLSGSR